MAIKSTFQTTIKNYIQKKYLEKLVKENVINKLKLF